MLFYDKDSKLDSLTLEESISQDPTTVSHDHPKSNDDLIKNSQKKSGDVKSPEDPGKYVLTGNVEADKNDDIIEDEKNEDNAKEVNGEDGDNRDDGDNENKGDFDEEYIEDDVADEEEEEENEELKEWNLHLQGETQR